MLKDIIYSGKTGTPTEPTRLMPYNFFNQFLPISLNVEDTFRIAGNVPTDGKFEPKRCFYLDELDHYLVFDVADPKMASIYLISAKTHEMVTSYTYMVETYPNHKMDDELVDVCVHHTEMDNKITVSFLIINRIVRNVSVAAYELEVKSLGEASQQKEPFKIVMDDLLFYSEIIPPGKPDEIALPYEIETVRLPPNPEIYKYPKFDPSRLVDNMKASFLIGELSPKYCNITIDTAGRYVVLVGSRIKCWLGPLLSFPVDNQYIMVMDKGGMNHRFALLGPQHNAMSFDEAEEHQPYKFSLTAWDGRYLLNLEDRRSRFLAPHRTYIGKEATEPPGASYTTSEKDWEGGSVADVYYPPRKAKHNFASNPLVTEVGYPTKWMETSNVEPTNRESTWNAVDICALFAGMEPGDIKPTPPYSADIVFLIDDSGSMGPHIDQIKTNIKNFYNTLVAMQVTDIRIGMASYSSNQVAVNDTSNPSLSMWAATATGAKSMADQLRVGLSAGTGRAHHWSAINWLANRYKFRKMQARTRYIVMVTDAEHEGDPLPMSSAIGSANEQDIKVCVVCTHGKYFEEVFRQTGGLLIGMSGAWGPTMAFEMATKIAADAGASDEVEDWWNSVARHWKPQIYYQYSPAANYKTSSFVTIFHDDVSYVTNGSIVRSKMNYLTIYDDYPAAGGRPQDSFYIPSLIPNEKLNTTFIIKNESSTGTMKKIKLELLDKPAGVEVTVNGFPDRLEPKEIKLISVDVQYTPTGGAENPGTRHLDIKYRVTYWMQHVTSCSGTRPTQDDVSEKSIGSTDLYFVQSTQDGSFVPGLSKEIGFDPLYTAAYQTTTACTIKDAVKQPAWKSHRLYVMRKNIMESEYYQTLAPGPIEGISGNKAEETGCVWLKARGPLFWKTERDYEVKVNKKTWYIVNQSQENTYVAHLVLSTATLPKHKEMGFMVIEYPEGNIVPPSTARPVLIYWQPIFNPEGDQMTHKTTTHPVQGSQEGTMESVWDHDSAFFNHLIFIMPGADTTNYEHLYTENIKGDGMILPVRPDQPLHKFDIKELTDVIYDTKVWMDVDVDQVEKNFRFVVPDGIWGGYPEGDENDIDIPPGTEPSDLLKFKECLSPASGLEAFPAYIDHKWKPNPEYLFHADTQTPYQLAPFNMEYAKPYIATLFIGNELIQSETISNMRVKDFTKYDDEGAELVPCDAGGQEKAGWVIDNFWPVPGDLLASMQHLATENDYIFKRTVHVKNKGKRKIPIRLVYGAPSMHGISLQSVKINGSDEIAPGATAVLEVEFRLHYTYQESKYLNMIKETIYIPRFDVPLSVAP